MQNPTLFRKRLIPDECICLKNDEILYMDDSIIVTKWMALKKRPDLHHGYSCYFLKEGYKVSKFYDEHNRLVYWYCDIIKYDYRKEDNSYVFTDLLADVLIYPDGFVKVVDIDEIAKCLEEGCISTEDVKKTLYQLNSLLEIVYRGDFQSLKKYVEKYEQLT